MMWRRIHVTVLLWLTPCRLNENLIFAVYFDYTYRLDKHSHVNTLRTTLEDFQVLFMSWYLNIAGGSPKTALVRVLQVSATSSYIEHSLPLLQSLPWSTGQSSCLQIQRSWFDSRRYQIFWEVVGLERGPLSLVGAIQELHGRKSSGSSLENSEYGRRDSSRWPCGTL
jgi:hypothetical protein